jgi:hypothetical protein
MPRRTATLLCGALLAAPVGCGGEDEPSAPPAASAPAPKDAGDSRFPDIRKAELTPSGPGRYTLALTVSSRYDSPERYADGWRVLAAGSGEELGSHTLAHDHASEQPFTREQPDLRIPDGVERITIEGRDTDNGYGGDTVTIDVPR